MFEVIQNGSKDIKFWNEACLKEKTREEWEDLFQSKCHSFWMSGSTRFMITSSGFALYESENCDKHYLGAVDFPAALFYR